MEITPFKITNESHTYQKHSPEVGGADRILEDRIHPTLIVPARITSRRSITQLRRPATIADRTRPPP